MQQQTVHLGAGVVGRDSELVTLQVFLTGGGQCPALVITGGPGIGKTTLWEVGVERARNQGWTVLIARPSEAEVQFSFAALADLLDAVDLDAVPGLATPQAYALNVALLRSEPGSAPPAPRAIATGLLSVLRAHADRGPLLVAVDDAHWLDVPSEQALAFAARRVRTDPVFFLLSRRDSEPSALERAFAPAGTRRIDLEALSFGALRTLLSRRIERPLPRRVLRQVFETSSGNPLFALELGQMLAERGIPEATDEMPVPKLIKEVVGARVARLPPERRRLLLAVALSPGLTTSQLELIGGEAAVEDAVEAGALLVDEDRVRAAHPLLAAAARANATARERRALQLVLAEVVEDEELCVRHLALGTDHPDGLLAARVAAASAHAVSRGAAGDAVELAAQALRLTPSGARERAERVLAFASSLIVAGERQRARELIVSEIDGLPSGTARVRAHLLLYEIDFSLVHVDESEKHLQKALVESANDPALHAATGAMWAAYFLAGRVARIEEAERRAAAALPAARRAGPAAEREVLFVLAFARKLRGLPIDDLCERFDTVSSDAFHIQRSVGRFAAERLGTRGHVREARAAFRRLLTLADDRGEALSSMWLLFQLCELELRAGEWKAAAQLLAECEESPDDSLRDTRAYDRCRALLAAGQGRVDEAERLAAATIEACKAHGYRWNLLEALRARGLAALLAHEPEVAAECFEAVWQYTAREGVTEPAEFPVAPDLVEALVELGRVDEARAVTNRLRVLSEEQDHPWGLASVARCDALLRLASIQDETAVTRLRKAAAAYDELGLRFDHARTLLLAGRSARRLKKWGAARELLGEATAAFEAIGSDGWADDGRAELDRIAARRPGQAGELTPSERRVAELAATGLGNKEIARKLVVTVHTVEVHLSHAYAKLGIRSRSQLAESLRVSAI